MRLTKPETNINRRIKSRFPIHRELRYKLLQDGRILEAGEGKTVNIGSGGVAFALDHGLNEGSFIELSISWPVSLENGCPMRLVIFGRVLRSSSSSVACTVDKYEFRTQARTHQATGAVRSDSMLQRFADGLRKENLKFRGAIGY